MTPLGTELLGVGAASLVLATFSVRSLTTLRCFAIASNVLFIGYGLAGGLLPILILHALLLPLNALRLWQLRRANGLPVALGTGRTCASTAGQRAAWTAPRPGHRPALAARAHVRRRMPRGSAVAQRVGQ